MKEYCVDYEIAEKLNENGFPQTTFCSYDINGTFWHGCDEEYSAPNSDEILKELPVVLKNKDRDFYYHSHIERIEDENKEYYEISYGYFSYGEWVIPIILPMKVISEEKLSNALAKMWLYLKKESHIK